MSFVLMAFAAVSYRHLDVASYKPDVRRPRGEKSDNRADPHEEPIGRSSLLPWADADGRIQCRTRSRPRRRSRPRDKSKTVAEAKAYPEVFANKTIGQVADYYV